MKNKKLLLIHGGPGFDDSYFYPYIENAKPIYDEIISYTLGSDTLEHSIENLQSELSKKISSIDGPCTLLGHSFGGALCIETLSNSPELQKKVKLILSNWIYDSEWIDIFNEDHPESAAISEVDGFRERTLAYLPYYFVDQSVGKATLEKIEYEEEVFDALSPYILNLDLRAKIENLKIPVFSIASELDVITPPKYLADINLPAGSKTFQIKGAGHFPFIERPVEFLAVLESIEENN